MMLRTDRVRHRGWPYNLSGSLDVPLGYPSCTFAHQWFRERLVLVPEAVVCLAGVTAHPESLGWCLNACACTCTLALALMVSSRSSCWTGYLCICLLFRRALLGFFIFIAITLSNIVHFSFHKDLVFQILTMVDCVVVFQYCIVAEMRDWIYGMHPVASI